MRRVELSELEKGDLILVRWLDASEIRCSVDEHEGNPEVYCKDWGVYLGISGGKRRMLIVGKDVVERHNDWGDSANNPFDDIVGANTTIKGNGYPVDYIATVSALFGE